MLNGIRLLIAEDFEETRDLLKLLFEMHGAQVVTAENGLEALVQARLEPFDAILLDLDMPEMDGLEAARKMRLGGYEGPIIALSAGTGSSLDWPSDDFSFIVHKPLSENDFERIRSGISSLKPAASGLMARFPEGPSDTEQALRSKFLLSLPKQERRLETLLQEGRLGEIRELAHKLRGIGTMAGFPEITEAGAAVESGSSDARLLLDRIRNVILTTPAHRLGS